MKDKKVNSSDLVTLHQKNNPDVQKLKQLTID